jgi:RNA polymerase sigma-70 factor, ECF subfamily
MSPEQEASNSEARCLLEEEVNALPDNYRTVFVLRDVEEIDAAEVAEILSITPENVKMRLFRARAFLRKRLYLRAGTHSQEAFLFHASRCDRVVNIVFEKLGIRQQMI